MKPLSLTNLADATRGSRVRITQVAASPDHSLRLRELGLCEGRTVQVLHPADPTICLVDRARIGLARRLAEKVFGHPVG